MRYHDAVSSLSERLGTDRWFLGSRYVLLLFFVSVAQIVAHPSLHPFALPRTHKSIQTNPRFSFPIISHHSHLTINSSPTALDALAFAYLHTLLHTHDDLRIEVAKRVNLVTWERRVYEAVRGAFVAC